MRQDHTAFFMNALQILWKAMVVHVFVSHLRVLGGIGISIFKMTLFYNSISILQMINLGERDILDLTI
jgi:hypothetical protein